MDVKREERVINGRATLGKVETKAGGVLGKGSAKGAMGSKKKSVSGHLPTGREGGERTG